MGTLREKQVERMNQNGAGENERSVQLKMDANLRQRFFFTAQSVISEFHEGVVVLRGHVGSFHEKQMVQELARRIDGVKVVVNRMVVDANATGKIVNEAVFPARSSEQQVMHDN